MPTWVKVVLEWVLLAVCTWTGMMLLFVLLIKSSISLPAIGGYVVTLICAVAAYREKDTLRSLGFGLFALLALIFGMAMSR